MTRAIGLNDLKVINEVRRLIKKYHPDIVYAHSSKAGAITRVADIGFRNYCIYNPHGWAFNMRCSSKKKTLYILIERVAAPFCDKIICISEAERKSALDKKICKENKLQVINNGVDIGTYKNSSHGAVKRFDLDIPEDAFVVGMVGRISQQKAPDVFVKAAKLIKESIPNSHFIIVGNGELEDQIRKYVEDNGFSGSLHITGWVDNPMSYVELFDVACLRQRHGQTAARGGGERAGARARDGLWLLRQRSGAVRRGGVRRRGQSSLHRGKAPMPQEQLRRDGPVLLPEGRQRHGACGKALAAGRIGDHHAQRHVS